MRATCSEQELRRRCVNAVGSLKRRAAMEPDLPRFVPPEVTAGQGFDFENEVVAYLLLCLLTGTEPWPGDGCVVQVACQQRDRGWQPDDVVLTLSRSDGERRCAVSVKSFEAITQNGLRTSSNQLDTEQLKQLWRLHLGRQAVTPPFDRERDLLGVVAGSIDVGLLARLETLRQRAEVRDGGEHDIPLSQEQKRFVRQWRCPEDVDASAHADERTVTLFLRQFRAAGFDVWHRSIPLHARAALRDPADANTDALWHDLQQIATDYRAHGGICRLVPLLDRMRGRHDLAAYPNHQADWDRLARVSVELLAHVDDTIDGFRFPREQELSEILRHTEDERVRGIAVLGESGCGKSVVLKRWAETLAGERWIWWDLATLDEAGPTAFAQRVGTPYLLGELLPAVAEGRAFLVLDGLDRLTSDQAWQNLGALLRHLKSGTWTIIASCQSESWDRVASRLEAAGLDPSAWPMVQVDRPELKALAGLLDRHPALRPVLQRQDLQACLLRPKVLDLLVRGTAHVAAANTAGWVGEAHAVEWIWQQLVRRGTEAGQRARLAKQLGTLLADRLLVALPESEIDPALLSVLSALQTDGICRLRDERVSFAHDLYGDWARQRVLLDHEADLLPFLRAENRLANPLWQRALRLHGVYLLEQGADPVAWMSALESLRAEPEAEGLLLDSVVFAGGAGTALEGVWPHLVAEDGRRLQVLLQRFEHIATKPHEHRIAALGECSGALSPAHLRSLLRIPVWRLWPPLLEVLVRHADEVWELAPTPFARLAEMWLRLTNEPKLTWQSELAAIVCEAAEGADASADAPDWYRRCDVHKDLYRAALAATPHCPDRIETFVRGRVRRVAANEEEAAHLASSPAPLRHVDNDFREVCLEEQYLGHLISCQPALAREVLLALLLEPEEDEPHLFLGRFPAMRPWDHVPVWSASDWHPAMPTHGPFLPFLQRRPAEALTAVLQLVNKATDAWTDAEAESHPSERYHVDIPGWGCRRGDRRTFYWYRGLLSNTTVSVALMAVEHWLYGLIDRDEPVEPWLQRIIEQSTSLAFAGLLAAVAAKQPVLLTGILRPLLAVVEFQVWEEGYGIYREAQLLAGMWWPRESPQCAERRAEWHRLQHRSCRLDRLSAALVAGCPEMADFFAEVRDAWQERLDAAAPDDPMLSNLRWRIPRYDPANYHPIDDPSGCGAVEYRLPPELMPEGQATREALTRWRAAFSLPYLFSDRIAADLPLGEADADRVWEAVQQVTADAAAGTADPGSVYSVDDVLCAGAAALLVRAGPWLESYPERRRWCVNTLLRITATGPLPNRPLLGIEKWPATAAHALPVLWSAAPTNRRLRHRIARLATAGDEVATQRLLAGAARHRSELGAEFGRLQHLVLQVARLRHRWMREGEFHRDLDWWLREPEAMRRRGWRRAHWWRRLRCRLGWVSGPRPRLSLRRETARLRRAFVRGAIPSACPSLTDFADWESLPTGAPPENALRLPGFDLELAASIYTWLPPLSEARDAAEREQWIEWRRDVALVTAEMLRPPHKRQVYRPSQSWLEWAFRGLASTVLQLRSPEQAERLWQPLLELGEPAGDALSTFLHHMLAIAMDEPDRRCSFLQHWRQMVAFAEGCPAWQDGAEPWASLMGWQWYHSPWSADHADLADGMSPVWRALAPRLLVHPPCRRAFVRFLAGEVSSGLRRDGVQWLAAHPPRRAGAGASNDQAAVARLLERCWADGADTIRTAAALRSAFLALLNEAGAEPLAKQLRDELAPW